MSPLKPGFISLLVHVKQSNKMLAKRSRLIYHDEGSIFSACSFSVRP